jgi:GntR family transcriptional regulator of arabinose operon
MKIDADNSAPKYLQLKNILRDSLSRHYQAGQKIPTEVELVHQFQVSRNTVRQAVDELVAEGILSKEQGRGTFFLGITPVKQRHDALIGVITPISSYIYPQVIQGILDVTHEEHYSIVLESSNVNPEKEVACLEQLLKKNIDGLIFEPFGGFKHIQESKSLRLLEEVTIPVVLMGWALDELNLSYVSLDDVEAGFRATSYLIKAGHTRIACIYPDDHIPGLQRYQGYRKALETFGIEHDHRLDRSVSIFKRTHTEHVISTLTKELLELGDDRPSALFFFNDKWALRGYVAIREAGLKIPDDISVMGFDNFEFAALAEVPLTTVVHPQEQIGKWAAEILFDEIKHKGQRIPRQMIIKPTIAIRNSVKFI